MYIHKSERKQKLSKDKTQWNLYDDLKTLKISSITHSSWNFTHCK